MLIVHPKIEGLNETLGMLNHLDAGLRDRKPFHKQAGMIVVAESQENFRAGGNPKWKPLSDVTIALRRKGKKYNNPQPLRDTGQLMASIGNKSKSGIYEIDPAGITIGTALKQAKYLHDGFETKGFISGKKVPGRPFLVLSVKGKGRILEEAEIFVSRRIKEAKA